VGAELPVPPSHDERPLRLPRSSWIRLAVVVALALVAIALFPRSGGDAPPVASLALIGTVIAGVTTVALYSIVRRDLRLPSRVATSLAFAFVLIALVKFVLAPLELVIATTLIGSAFRALDRQPQVVAEAGAIVSLFWLGLGFLALYHVLWIVYVLVLGSIWPLRTVVPK
jgi:hypothetical protein